MGRVHQGGGRTMSLNGTLQRLKVLFLVNIPSPYRVDFFNELGTLCDLTVLYERRAAADRDSSWSGHGATTFREVFLPGIRTKADAALCPSVLKYLRDRSFDIVVVGGYSTPTGMLAIAALKALKIPFMLNVDGGFIREDHWLVGRAKTWFIGSATAWLSTGMATSKYLAHYGARQEAIHEYPFTSVRAADVATHPATMSEREDLRRTLGICEPRSIVSVGQFIHRKGFDVLIRAAAELDQNVGVYIIGGTETEEYSRLRADLQVTNVHFIGFLNADQLRQYYRAADLFVLPTREDVWGLVVNEAMAQGLPVVTTDRCGAGVEMVEDGVNGAIVPTDNVRGLVVAVQTMLSCDNTASLAAASLTTASRYTIERMALSHLDGFRQIYDQRSSRISHRTSVVQSKYRRVDGRGNALKKHNRGFPVRFDRATSAVLD